MRDESDLSLEPLEHRDEIARAFQMMATTLCAGVEPIKRSVGYKGGSDDFAVYWRPEAEYWALPEKEPSVGEARFWLCFGVQDPREEKALNITCEINPPHDGINRRVSGVFLRDDAGRIYVGHSGAIRGGKKGVGKEAFWANYRGRNEIAINWPDGQSSPTVVFGPLDDPRLIRQIGHFVHEVDRIKKLVAGDSAAAPGPESANDAAEELLPKLGGFTPEFSGAKKPYTLSARIAANCNHGVIVDALAAALTDAGYTIGNDQQRDLYICNDSDIAALFEVKTAADTSSIYGAVGQLMVHGVGDGPVPRRILVIPQEPSKELIERLRRLGIRVAVYEWNEDRPILPDVGEMLGHD